MPAYDVGNSADDFKIYIDDGLGGTLVYIAILSAFATSLEHLAVSLINSRRYNFVVSAENVIDEGPIPDTTAILAATIPKATAEPSTVS